MDFDWPLRKTWDGFLLPERLREPQCRQCAGCGYTPYGRWITDQWYGQAPFDPFSTGSTPHTEYTPGVRRASERNVSRAPDRFGTGDDAVRKEARRLAALFNGMWMHHLSQADVHAFASSGSLSAAFTDAERLPAPAEVNEWHLDKMLPYAATVAVWIARAQRDDEEIDCRACDGERTVEAYPGQRAEAQEWERHEPPTGNGWQIWETISEGSPVSRVFATREELIQWLMPAGLSVIGPPLTRAEAEAFVESRCAPTAVVAGARYPGARVHET
jgi:hypothetical protein